MTDHMLHMLSWPGLPQHLEGQMEEVIKSKMKEKMVCNIKGGSLKVSSAKKCKDIYIFFVYIFFCKKKKNVFFKLGLQIKICQCTDHLKSQYKFN